MAILPDKNQLKPVLSLRILHLEDCAADCELVRRLLEGGKVACEIKCAIDRSQFVDAFAVGKYDLILSDYTIPGYDGMSALALVREKYPEVPFVFVSGTLGEEQAIESFKCGATDYVLKDRLERLVPAVHRALSEADERNKRCAAESALRKAEARFRDIFENAVEGIYQADLQGQLIDANRSMAKLCGYASPTELCSRVTALDIQSNHQAEFIRLIIENGEVSSHESQIRRKDGIYIWISQSARAVRGEDHGIVHYEAMVTDVTERKLAEAALLRSEERFREMAERIGDVFYVTSVDSDRMLYVSPSYEIIWGRPLVDLELQLAQWIEAVEPDQRKILLQAREDLVNGRNYAVEYCIRRPKGETRWIEDRCYLIRDANGGERRAVGVATDITRRRQLERQLLQAQKMEAVGQLAGGMAHDFNNVLTVVTGYARLLLDRPALPPDVIEAVTQIFTAGSRAANLTRQLLVFSRKQPVEPRAIDLNQVASDIASMLRHVIGEQIKLELTSSGASCPVKADAGMMEQVLMNLAVNARDAMPRGGLLRIGVNPLVIDDAATRHHPEARSGNFISLSVQDNGCGIPAENIGRIFEPFFSTKEVGRGTGLGLSMVFGIVQQHQGWIEIESTVDAGTCFRILVPAIAAVVTAPKWSPGKSAVVSGGSETLLLVEDEPAVREFVVAVLRSHGYRVLQACSGIDALEVWKWHGSRITLLVSDVVLPEGLSGLELVTRLRREKPALRVVLMSGYTSDSGAGGFRVPAGVHFIQKPFKPQVLARAVRDALDDKYER